MRVLVSRGGAWFHSLFRYLNQAANREGDDFLKALAQVPIIPVWGHGGGSKHNQHIGGQALRVTLARGGGHVMLRPGLEGGDDDWSLHALVDSGAGIQSPGTLRLPSSVNSLIFRGIHPCTR